MELVNILSKYSDDSKNGLAIRQEVLEGILLMLAPIVPHICKHLWHELGHNKDIVIESWPSVDESALEQDSIKMMLQVNGKLRGNILVSVSASKDDIEKLALADDNVMRFVDDKPVKKVIVVPKRLVNIVV
jgi:leucyl-tRNA synthetase